MLCLYGAPEHLPYQVYHDDDDDDDDEVLTDRNLCFVWQAQADATPSEEPGEPVQPESKELAEEHEQDESKEEENHEQHEEQEHEEQDPEEHEEEEEEGYLDLRWDIAPRHTNAIVAKTSCPSVCCTCDCALNNWRITHRARVTGVIPTLERVGLS